MATQVIQLSDFHLHADPNTLYQGIRADVNLVKVLEFIRHKFPLAKCFILTGDVAHDEKLETYKHLRYLLKDLVEHCHFIPGNHDNPSAMKKIFPSILKPGFPPMCFSISVTGWRLIGLNSHISGEVYGRLDDMQLQWLDNQLQEHNNEPTIIFVHHPPISVGSPWLDRISLEESGSLINILSRAKHVQAVSTGHIHQEFQGNYIHDVQVLGSPSTAVQFRPQTPEPEIDSLTPGFRLFELDHKSFRTKVIRISTS